MSERPGSTIAVIQTAFIGDVVLATPLFEAARRANPEARIIGVVRSGGENILGNNPFVDDVLVWDKHGGERGFSGILGLAKRLREQGVSTALIPHRSFRTGLAALLSGVRVRVGFSKGGGRFFHTIRVPWRLGMHEVERNLMLAKTIGWEVSGLRPLIVPDDRDRAVVDSFLDGAGMFAVFAPGSVWPTKMWPVECFAEVGTYFARKGIRIVISGGRDDRDVCAAVASGVTESLDLSGALTLRQSAELYRRARFVLTGDTAPQHLAAAMGVPVFSIFGPTIREFGFWPYSDSGVIIESPESCRPCGIHGHRSCPERTHRCMRRITSDRVIRTIEDTLDFQ